MKYYNVTYSTKGKITTLTNINEQELQQFLNSLQREEESSLDVKQIKQREEEEER